MILELLDLGVDVRQTAGVGENGLIDLGLAHASPVAGHRRGLRPEVLGRGPGDPLGFEREAIDGCGMPGGIAHLAQRARRPVIAFAGAVRRDRRLKDFFDATFALAIGPMSTADCIRDAKVLLVRAAERAAKLIALSRK